MGCRVDNCKDFGFYLSEMGATVGFGGKRITGSDL